MANHRITVRAVRRLSALTGDPHQALTALFARASLETAARVDPADVLAVERRAIARSFHGSRAAYLQALTRRHATLAVARGVILDQLRRIAIARKLAAGGSGETTLQWTDDRESALANSAICLHDDLPGSGDFPASDALEIGVVPLPALLPFLFGDRTAPAPPSQPAAASAPGQVSLTWSYGSQPDLAGYVVARAAAAGGPYAQIGGPAPLARPTFTDTSAPAGQPSFYVVRAVDSSGNLSSPSPVVFATPG